MTKIISLLLIASLSFALEGAALMQHLYELPAQPHNVSVTEYTIPLNSEDPITICNIPENHYAMLIVCWQDVKVQNILGENINLVDDTQSIANVVRMKNGHAWKIGPSGNIFVKPGPLIIWVKGGAAQDLQGNLRVKVRINKNQEKK
jgi:hypothetical protein